MDTLNVGIIGCGNISGIYLPEHPQLSRAVAAGLRRYAARSGAGAGRAATASRRCRWTSSSRSEDIDLVVNLTVPARISASPSRRLRAGKHVFSEKPLAVDFEQGRKLVDEAEARGLLLGCAPDTFLGAGGRLARKLVDEGAVGRILRHGLPRCRTAWSTGIPDPEFFFKPGGGPILDIGALLSRAPSSICRAGEAGVRDVEHRLSRAHRDAESPRKGHRIAVETPTSVMALLEFASGAQVTFCMSWDVWKHGHPPIELYGTEGSLRVPDPNFFGGDVEITERGGDWQLQTRAACRSGSPNWRSPNWATDVPHARQLPRAGPRRSASAALNGTPHRPPAGSACTSSRSCTAS